MTARVSGASVSAVLTPLTGPDAFRKSLCLGMTLWPPASPWLHTTVLPTYPPLDTRVGAIFGGEYDSVFLDTCMDLCKLKEVCGSPPRRLRWLPPSDVSHMHVW